MHKFSGATLFQGLQGGVLSLAVLILSACGGGDSTSDPTPASTNQAPVARVAGNPVASVQTGTAVTLDGLGSSDADGQLLDYRWRVVSAPAGSALAGTGGTQVRFALTPDVAGDYVIGLTASDGITPSAEATVSLHVTADWVIRQDYGGYALTYDCTTHTALQYSYSLGLDNGTAARPSNFTFDPMLPSGCGQQTSTASYASIYAGYDRGHLVTSNHMDYDADFIKRANYMTNIVPQVSSFNQNVWLDAENVAECYRDIAPVQVYGGVVYTDPSNDFFLASHGIRTPEYFWKAVITTDPATGAAKAIAWYFPNVTGLTSADPYLVSIAELEQRVGAAEVGITASAEVKAMKPAVTWPLPAGCNLN